MTLGEAELASIQRAIAETFTDSCSVYRASESADGYGGVEVDWEGVGSSVACRYGPVKREQVGMFADKLAGRRGLTITLPAGTSVAVGDRIEVAGLGTFEVVGVFSWSEPLCIRVLAVEVS